MLVEGSSVRSIERVTGVHRDMGLLVASRSCRMERDVGVPIIREGERDYGSTSSPPNLALAPVITLASCRVGEAVQVLQRPSHGVGEAVQALQRLPTAWGKRFGS